MVKINIEFRAITLSVNEIEGHGSRSHFITAVKDASPLEVGQLQSNKLLKQCQSSQRKDNQDKSLILD